jgi:ribosomal protein L11 methylase PrmA
MKNGRALPGSFRDPSGRVYEIDGRIIRTVANRFAEEFEFVECSGLFQELIARNWLLPFDKTDLTVLGAFAAKSKYALDVSPLKFISYPYEWSFSALKAAALLHLEIHLAALDYGVTLSDASAYNIQFEGARPIFIDHLSFRCYRPGEIWAGHRQFCEQFLNPLLLRALLGIPHNEWYRGTQEGIKAHELSRLLKWPHRLNLGVLTHVVLQSFFQRSVENNSVQLSKDITTAPLPLPSFQRLLKKLRSWIGTLRPADTAKTVWQDYMKTLSYSSVETDSKKRFVADFVTRIKPKAIWDLGCNTGEYCFTALEAGAEYAVGFDYDQGVLESAFARSRERNSLFQALFFDAANPSPNQGWNEQERSGFRSRASADAVLALAFVHHLAIGRNVPLDQLLDWIFDLAPAGVIEFVPKNDLMVQALLRYREDIFSEYTEAAFLNRIKQRASIIDTASISSSGRLLVSWEKRRNA